MVTVFILYFIAIRASVPASAIPTEIPRVCKILLRSNCLGPSLKIGEVCLWNSQNNFCTSVKGTQEEICRQYSGSAEIEACQGESGCVFDTIGLTCTVGIGKSSSKSDENVAETKTGKIEESNELSAITTIVVDDGKCDALSPEECKNNLQCNYDASTAECTSMDGDTGLLPGATKPKTNIPLEDCTNFAESTLCDASNTCEWKGGECTSRGLLRTPQSPKHLTIPIPIEVIYGVASFLGAMLLSLAVYSVTCRKMKQQREEHIFLEEYSMRDFLDPALV